MEPSESTSTFEHLLSSLEVTPDPFLQPSTSLQAASLVAAKRILDPVVSEYSVFKEVVLKGLDVEQVWEQIRLVGDQVRRRLEKEGRLNGKGLALVTNGKHDEESDEESMMENYDSKEGSQDVDDDEEVEDWEDEEEKENEEMQNGEEISEDDKDVDNDSDREEDSEEADEFPNNPEEDEDSHSGTEQTPSTTLKPFKKDVHGLNDEFFSIDDFNRLTEQQDTLAENDDDDDIDYFGDPDEQDSNSEEENPDEITYQDFYLPPPNSSKKRKRAHFEDSDIPAEEELDDEARTSRFQKDLFAEESNLPPSTEVAEKLSKHAKKQALIRKEVEQLEQENISQKQWMYTGEASSFSRPKNSLLEVAEEIDVERSVKPVPLVTEERTKSLEEIIKQRILENSFNDVVRKLPPSLTGKSHEIQDEEFLEPGMKSKRSLAEIYEQEHLKRLDPENNPSPLSQSVKKQHEEIDVLWKQLSHQLDSLTSWRFIPEPEIVGEKVVANILAVEMEDARPEAEAGQTSLLAPQEVYRPVARQGEVVVGGIPVARGEMSREEKARNRKREGKRREKRVVAPVEGGRKDVVDTLKKGGVKIIANGKGRGGSAADRGRGTGNRGGRMAT